MEGAERKKAFLKQYQRAKRGLISLELELQELYTAAEMPGKGYDGMPKAPNPSDLSARAVQIVELREKMAAQRKKAADALYAVDRAISEMAYGYEREILTRRYIRGQKWEEISEEMHLAIRSVHRYHGYALAQIVIPKKEEAEK